MKFLLKEWNNFLKKPLLMEGLPQEYVAALATLPPKVAEHYKKVASQYFIFDKESFDVDEQSKIKKEVVMTVLKKSGFKKFPEDHILIASNLTVKEYETGASIKGTSGKSTPAEQIAAARPDASGYIVYDNLSKGLGEIQKGLARHAKNSDPEIRAKIEKMATLSKNSSEYKTLDAQVKTALSSMNIQTMKVDESGNASQIHGAATTGAREFKEGARAWRELRRNFYDLLIKKTGTMVLANQEDFKKTLSKYQNLVAVYNDVVNNPSVDAPIKKGTAAETSAPDLRTLYVAPLEELSKSGTELRKEVQSAVEQNDIGRVHEIEQELGEIKKEVERLSGKLHPYIEAAAKELNTCYRELQKVKDAAGNFKYSLGQGAETPEEQAVAAEKPDLNPSDQSVVKIFDFDGTLFDTRAFYETGGIVGQELWSVNFYMTYLRPQIKRSFIKRVGEAVKPLALADDLKSDPANTYIVTSISSAGFDKHVEYFANLLQKKDQTLIKFLQFLNQHREDRGRKTPEETYAELYPKWIGSDAAEQPAATQQAPSTTPAKKAKAAKDYKKSAYEKGTEEDQMGYEADRDAALDDNEETSLDERLTRRNSLRENIRPIRLRMVGK